MKKNLVLAILDGYGIRDSDEYNAIKKANTPILDSIFHKYPMSMLKCSGKDVGLPEGQMGNSEVGHTNIGAGRIVYQELTRISKEIEDGDFFKNPALLEACVAGKRLHIMGLLSDGGVHSHMEHLYALLDLCRKKKIKTYIHCFLDGRDTPPKSGIEYIKALLDNIEAKGGDISIATVTGRFYAMDRDKRMERTEAAYAALAYGEGESGTDPLSAIELSYAQGVTDEFMLPHVFQKDGVICGDDSVIFFNFRPDRARQITRSFTDPDFDGFLRRGGCIHPHFVCFTRYDATMPGVSVAFPPTQLGNIFGEYISKNGLTQLRIAETEKYAHVTFFFNGGEEKQFEGESRILVPSPKIETYDLKPEMSAPEVADKCAAAIRSGEFDVVILNFANCDMVGHTGDFHATVSAVEAVDAAMGQVLDAANSVGGTVIITADHGNAEMMKENGVPFTAHTTSPVPFVVCRDGVGTKDGRLCDIAPTMLDLLGLPLPPEMTGESLILHRGGGKTH